MKIIETTLAASEQESYTLTPDNCGNCKLDARCNTQTLAHGSQAITREVAALVRNSHEKLIALQMGDTIVVNDLFWKKVINQNQQIPEYLDWWNHLAEFTNNEWAELTHIGRLSPGGAPLYQVAMLQGFFEKIPTAALQEQLTTYNDDNLEVMLRCMPDCGGYRHLLPTTGKLRLPHGNLIPRQNLTAATRLPYHKMDYSQRYQTRKRYTHGTTERNAIFQEVITWANRPKIPARANEYLHELLPGTEPEMLPLLAQIPERVLLEMEQSCTSYNFLHSRRCLNLETWKKVTSKKTNNCGLAAFIFLANQTGGASWAEIFTYGFSIFTEWGNKLTGWHTPETVLEIFRRSQQPNASTNLLKQKPPVWLAKIVTCHPDRFAQPEWQDFVNRCYEIII